VARVLGLLPGFAAFVIAFTLALTSAFTFTPACLSFGFGFLLLLFFAFHQLFSASHMLFGLLFHLFSGSVALLLQFPDVLIESAGAFVD
jgi:hypothetical protein